MKSYRPTTATASFPIRQLLGKATLIVLMATVITLIASSRGQREGVERLSMAVNDGLSPILDVLSRPIHKAIAASTWLEELVNLRSEHALLKSQNADLKKWETLAVTLQAENESLRRQLHFVPPPESTYITARIVGDAGTPYVRSALISAGEDQGVKKGQAIVGDGNLVGRVTSVGRNSARVLLLTDLNSRVPVIIEESRERAIAAGNNTGNLVLQYVPDGKKLKVGDRVLTSGDGGLFPAGLPVGVVSAIDKGTVVVHPTGDWSTLEHVTAVDYSLDMAR